MYCTFQADRFIVAEWAASEARAGIFMQFGAIAAKFFFFVIEPAIKLYHLLYGNPLSCEPGFIYKHKILSIKINKIV
jgi:hypothetical protein